MEIGSKVVLMRDKRYGLNSRGRYSEAMIAELTSRDYQADETLTFTVGDDQVTAKRPHYGSLRFADGWYPIFVNKQLPYEDAVLAADLARYIDSNRKAFVLHIGAQAGDYTLANAIVRDERKPYQFGSQEVTINMPVILDKIDAAPGSLIACDLKSVTENENGLISYQVRDIMVLKDQIQRNVLEEYRWPAGDLTQVHDLEELVTCHDLAKIKDEVLYYVLGDDSIVITSQGLRAHQSGDLQADAWNWGGENDGFHVAHNLAWTGSGEDVELEADTGPADDQEVARILMEHGLDSLELIEHDVLPEHVMAIAAILGDADKVKDRYAQMEAIRDESA